MSIREIAMWPRGFKRHGGLVERAANQLHHICNYTSIALSFGAMEMPTSRCTEVRMALVEGASSEVIMHEGKPLHDL